MAVIWTPVESTQDFAMFIYLTTGVWPKTTGLIYGSAEVSGTDWSTKLDISSGPYILYAVRNRPDSGGDIQIKVTIDGTLLVDDIGYSPTSDNSAISLFFDGAQGKDFGPVFARSSIKIESREYLSGTKYIEWLYAAYTLT